jgi:hypothetical protein
MSVTYNTVLRNIAIAVNALTGATPATLQTTYATIPLTSANFQSSIFPFLALKDKMIDGEAELITTVASTGDHPYRSALITQTANLPYGSLVKTNAAGVPVIGIFGDVRDVATSQPLTKNELRQVQDRVVNPGGMWLIPVWWYALSDRRLYHTVANAVVDVIAYTRPSSDSLDLTTNVFLPDDALAAMVNAALRQCIRDDEFVLQASRFGQLYDQWVQQVKEGYMSVDPTSQVVEKAA